MSKTLCGYLKQNDSDLFEIYATETGDVFYTDTTQGGDWEISQLNILNPAPITEDHAGILFGYSPYNIGVVNTTTSKWIIQELPGGDIIAKNESTKEVVPVNLATEFVEEPMDSVFQTMVFRYLVQHGTSSSALTALTPDPTLGAVDTCELRKQVDMVQVGNFAERWKEANII